MALRLYANSLSPFVRKVRITLYEKAVAFDALEIERGSQRAELLRINPRGEVPALVDAETVVTGSAMICDYLEDLHPRTALLPAAPPRAPAAARSRAGGRHAHGRAAVPLLPARGPAAGAAGRISAGAGRTVRRGEAALRVSRP